MGDAQYEYVEGQGRPHFPALLAGYQAESDAAVFTPGTVLDLPYGPHPRQRFDLFTCAAPAAGVLLYLHAGYWQSRDKAQFRFLAPGWKRRGLHVAFVNYPLCPEVSLAQLTAAVQPCVHAVRERIGPGALPLAVAGHSAGAQLAVELALATPVDGVLGISGVYDPQPLLATTLNARLQLDAASARAADVTVRVASGNAPGLWVVGGAETAAFQAQNARMHAAWGGAGNASSSCAVAGADHFTVLRGGWEGAFETWWQAVAARHRPPPA